MRVLTWCTVLLLGWASLARAENWPCWRGPRGDGTSRETSLPQRWGPDRNVRWKAPIPGSGHSSPAVCGDRVFLTWCVEEKKTRVLGCFDRRDGKLLWQRTVLTAPLERKHGENSYASATPATDGRHVDRQRPSAPAIEVHVGGT